MKSLPRQTKYSSRALLLLSLTGLAIAIQAPFSGRSKAADEICTVAAFRSRDGGIKAKPVDGSQPESTLTPSELKGGAKVFARDKGRYLVEINGAQFWIRSRYLVFAEDSPCAPGRLSGSVCSSGDINGNSGIGSDACVN